MAVPEIPKDTLSALESFREIRPAKRLVVGRSRVNQSFHFPESLTGNRDSAALFWPFPLAIESDGFDTEIGLSVVLIQTDGASGTAAVNIHCDAEVEKVGVGGIGSEPNLLESLGEV